MCKISLMQCKLVDIGKIRGYRHLSVFEVARRAARLILWMKATGYVSSKLLRSKLAHLASKGSRQWIKSAFYTNFWHPSSSARWQTILEFHDIWCGSSWTHARPVWPGRVTLASLLCASVASKLFSSPKFHFRDAAAGNHSRQCSHWWF